MDDSSRSHHIKAERLRHRSRSTDSEDERRRTRRREDREAEGQGSRGGRDNGLGSSRGLKDKYDDRDRDRERTRRRSRSPRRDYDRKTRDDRDSKYRSRRDRSGDRKDSDSKNKSKGDRSPARKDGERGAREGSGLQMTRKSKGPLPSQAAAFQGNADPGALVAAGDSIEVEKQKPNFSATGLLAAASNAVAQADGTSITLKYHEPAEARKPPARDLWKLFVFKGADLMETIELSLRSCWLIGRELAVVDMAAEHPSISKQHAVIQFRYIEKKNEYGDKLGKVKPYLIDLESANGTLLNKDEVPASRYLELRDKDMIQFGHSTREYVLMLSPKD